MKLKDIDKEMEQLMPGFQRWQEAYVRNIDGAYLVGLWFDKSRIDPKSRYVSTFCEPLFGSESYISLATGSRIRIDGEDLHRILDGSKESQELLFALVEASREHLNRLHSIEACHRFLLGLETHMWSPIYKYEACMLGAACLDDSSQVVEFEHLVNLYNIRLTEPVYQWQHDAIARCKELADAVRQGRKPTLDLLSRRRDIAIAKLNLQRICVERPSWLD